MKKILLLNLLIIGFSLSAPLKKSDKFVSKISKFKEKQHSRNVNLSNSKIYDKEEAENRPIIFKVTKAKEDKKILDNLGLYVSDKSKVKFNEKKGKYFYHNNELYQSASKSVNITDEDIDLLKSKSGKLLENLIGEKGANFIFANTETDWVLLNGESEPKKAAITFRYTRKINGYHIIDNTSFARLTFTGDYELSEFEIVDPEIIAIKPVKKLILASSSEERLEEYALNKNTARKLGDKDIEEVKVNAINAKDIHYTYLSQKLGEETYLYPNISIYSNYELENGDNFNDWVHLGLDADITPNIKEEWLETSER